MGKPDQEIDAHWVERYGAKEVREWFFEVWNEPNLKAFWTGTQQEYFKLYRLTVEAVKGVDHLLKVGGPVTAKNAWISEFLEFCRRTKCRPISSPLIIIPPTPSERWRGHRYTIAARTTSRHA